MKRFFNGRPRWAATAALAAGLAVTGFFGVRAAVSEHNPPATIKTSPRSEAAAHRGYSTVVKKVTPAVVNISSSRVIKNNEVSQMRGRRGQDQGDGAFDMDPFFRQFFGNDFGGRFNVPKERREKSLGSGVIVSPEGYILTNNHVVDHATEVTVTLADKRDFKARVIGTDPRTDIAVLKIDGSNFPTLTLADSSKVEVGDVVLAIGDPFGVGQTVTSGIVSATGRSLGGQIEEVEDFIQTDAPINPGNSGGPLVNAAGDVIGMNTAAATGSPTQAASDIGFAIPIDTAKAIVEEIEAGQPATGITLGERGLIGVQVLTVAEAEGPEGLAGTPRFYFGGYTAPVRAGAVVAEVASGLPAATLGIQVGDVIVQLGGHAVTSPISLTGLLGHLRPYHRVAIGWVDSAGGRHSGIVTLAIAPVQ